MGEDSNEGVGEDSHLPPSPWPYVEKTLVDERKREINQLLGMSAFSPSSSALMNCLCQRTGFKCVVYQ